LRAPYIERMVSIPFKDFSEIIRAGEMIDTLVSTGTLSAPSFKSLGNGQKKNFPPKRKEGEVNMVQRPYLPQPSNPHNPGYHPTYSPLAPYSYLAPPFQINPYPQPS